MANPKWGRKHICLGCQAPFYDMRRSPITCPKCGVAHRPVVLLKSDGRPPRKSRILAAAPVPAAAEPELVPASASEDDIPAIDDDTPEADDVEEEEVEEDEAAGAGQRD